MTLNPHPNPNPQSLCAEGERLTGVTNWKMQYDPKLTRTPRGLRRARTGYACQPPALGTYRTRRAACPQGPTYCTYGVRVPASGVGYVPPTVATQVRPHRCVRPRGCAAPRARPSPSPSPSPSPRPRPSPSPSPRPRPSPSPSPSPRPSPSPSPSPRPSPALGLALALALALP